MIKAIAIDLDDTLLDTTGILAPAATHQAFEVLIKNGLSLTKSQCEAFRALWVKTMSHREVFEKLALEFGNTDTQSALPEAIDTFYKPNIPKSLPLLEGAQPNLEFLCNRYELFLVTAGEKQSQLEKVAALKIERFFKKIFVTDSLKKQRKKEVFLQILQESKILPNQLMCIGNSLLSEIADALEIGAMACHFDYGERRGDPHQLLRLPHYSVKSHSELISVCQL